MAGARSLADQKLKIYWHKAVKDESLGLETKGTETLGLVLNFGTCLVSDENFWDSLVPVSSSWYNFYLVSSRSRPDLDE